MAGHSGLVGGVSALSDHPCLKQNPGNQVKLEGHQTHLCITLTRSNPACHSFDNHQRQHADQANPAPAMNGSMGICRNGWG